ncbi:YggT family protein [Chloroflexota bacterium]
MTILFDIIRLVCQILTIAIFIRAVMTWFSPAPNVLTMLLDRITEPILSPLRRIIPRTGMFDFTPMVAIILLQLITYLLP